MKNALVVSRDYSSKIEVYLCDDEEKAKEKLVEMYCVELIHDLNNCHRSYYDEKNNRYAIIQNDKGIIEMNITGDIYESEV